ncbi:MAG: GNAT family N-acetyltransferase [Gilvibacter sp.]
MIREYQEKDLSQIIAIWHEAQSIAHPFLQPEFVEEVKGMMQHQFIPNAKTWVFQTNEELIGFIAMMQNEIGGLFVKPKEQQKGVGGMLLAYVSKFHERLEVEVFDKNNIGKPFYIKHGFVMSSEYVHDATNQKVHRMLCFTNN